MCGVFFPISKVWTVYKQSAVYSTTNTGVLYTYIFIHTSIPPRDHNNKNQNRQQLVYTHKEHRKIKSLALNLVLLPTKKKKKEQHFIKQIRKLAKVGFLLNLEMERTKKGLLRISQGF